MLMNTITQLHSTTNVLKIYYYSEYKKIENGY